MCHHSCIIDETVVNLISQCHILISQVDGSFWTKFNDQWTAGSNILIICHQAWIINEIVVNLICFYYSLFFYVNRSLCTKFHYQGTLGSTILIICHHPWIINEKTSLPHDDFFAFGFFSDSWHVRTISWKFQPSFTKCRFSIVFTWTVPPLSG